MIPQRENYKLLHVYAGGKHELAFTGLLKESLSLSIGALLKKKKRLLKGSEKSALNLKHWSLEISSLMH